MRALLRLAARRQPHEIAMATYRNGDDAGLGTALQLVTDYTPLLTESITVLLRRQGVAIVDLMDPVFSVERAADGTLLSATRSTIRKATRRPMPSAGFICSCRRPSTPSGWHSSRPSCRTRWKTAATSPPTPTPCATR